MFGLIKKKPRNVIFEGFYWLKGKSWELKGFKVGASSEEEAKNLVLKNSDCLCICVIGEEK